MNWQRVRAIFSEYDLIPMGYSDGESFRCKVYHRKHGTIKSSSVDPKIIDLIVMSEEELKKLAYSYSVMATFS